jgi:hypothetical protein
VTECIFFLQLGMLTACDHSQHLIFIVYVTPATRLPRGV